MTALIERLEAAAEGSRELDDELAALNGWSRVASMREPLKVFWHHPNGRTIESPHYTTSLDAKLPGENIAHVHAPDWHSSKPAGWWQAAQDVGEGRAVYGYGYTEPLARRIAALKALEPSE